MTAARAGGAEAVDVRGGRGGVVSANPVSLEAYDTEGRPAHAALARALTRLRGALADLEGSRPAGLRVDHRVEALGRLHLDTTTALAELAVEVAAAFRSADSGLHGPWPVRDVVAWPRCLPGDGTFGAAEGGALPGPGGELYPVVAPYVVVDGARSYRPGAASGADPLTRGGADDGWIAVEESLSLVDTAVGSLFGAKSAAHAANGAARIAIANRTAQQHGRIRAVRGGGAVLAPQQAPRAVPGAPHTDPPQREADRPAKSAARARAAYGGTGLLLNLASGWSLASGLDAARAAAQHVVYERHPDGRRRARVWRYRVAAIDPGSSTPGGEGLMTSVAWQGPDGGWIEETLPAVTATDRAPGEAVTPVARAAPGVVEWSS